MKTIGSDAAVGGARELVQVSEMPRVWVADGFVDEVEAAAVLDHVPEENSDRARTLNAKRDETGFSFEWPIDGDPVLEKLRDRVTALLGMPNALGETFRFRRYRPDDGHPPHLDCYEVSGHSLVFTALMHLEESVEGGETVFPESAEGPLTIAPQRGRLVLWANHLPNGQRDPLSNHEGARLVRGSKTTLTWFVYAPAHAAAHTPGNGKYEPVDRGPGTRLFFVDDGVPSATMGVMAEACERQGVQFVHVDVRQFDFSCMSPLEAGDMIFRPSVSADAVKVEQHLYVDGAATLYRDPEGVFFDTGASWTLFERAGIPTPRAVFCHTTDRARLKNYAAFVGGFPLIAKFAGGSGGVNVVLVESLQGLYSLADHSFYNGRSPYLTAYIPDAEHWRLVVVGDEVVAGYRNQQQEDDFRTFDAEREEDYRLPRDPAMAASAIGAVRALRVELGGVDILVHPSGRHYVLEANFPCYFATAQQRGGFDIAGAIVERLQKKAARLIEAGAV
jgi:hypothetical protein